MILVAYIILVLALDQVASIIVSRVKEGSKMENDKCKDCGRFVSACICPAVAKFFEENGHLMAGRRQEAKPKSNRFFYWEPSMSGKTSGVQ